VEKSASERYRAAVAVLEAKRLHHPLSQLSKHQLRYPHQQIRDYLLDAQVLGWGILTNGNLWRLYCRDAKRHEYFELNFEVAIQSLDGFKCFLAFFSPEAFRRDATGRCRLDEIREQAANVQTELEDNLRQRVFSILADLANGFADRPENGIGEGELDTLYQNCLIYLYRLLFVLYAEGRDLLPVNRPDRKYLKNLSLARLRRGLQNFSDYDDRHLTRLCESLRDLFRLINGANERMNRDYGVPRYNGGLFDPEKYPLLERWVIADADLATVLRGLMFSPPPERDKPALPIQTVDFADLRVQHLGSIYEGLLEHHLVKGEDGRLRLDIDRAERKATGTYYTPDYIVKYIVENTVGPLLKEIEEREPVKAAVAAQERSNAFAERALKLNILDPAMGSGHFLVETVIFMADHIVHHPTTRYLDGEKRGEPKAEQEIAYWRRRVVEACIYGVDLNPLAVELAKLSLWLVTIATDKPLNFLDHHLRCGNSLIGARLDDLSELPVRKTRALRERPEQHVLIIGERFQRAVAEVLRGIHAIEEQDSDDRETVKDKEERWRAEIEPRLRPFGDVADLWTSAFFGNEMDEGTYIAQAQAILAGGTAATPSEQDGPGGPTSVSAGSSDATERVPPADPPAFRAIAESRRFFHWELAFPEVFFNDDGTPKDNPGFDAVIGNPPYDVISEKEQCRSVAAEKAFYESQPCLECAVGGKLNLYRLFGATAVRLLARGGRHSFVVPMALLADAQSRPLRAVLLKQYGLEKIEAFPQKDDPRNRVFFQAKLPTCIYVLRNRPPTRFVVRIHPGKDITDTSPILDVSADDIHVLDPDNLSIPSAPDSRSESIRLAIKLRNVSGQCLGKYAPSQQGEVNLTTHAHFLSNKPVGPVVLRGAHVGRYILHQVAKQGEPKYLHVDEFLAAQGPGTKAHDYRFRRIGYQRGAAIDNWRRIIATIIEAGCHCSDTVNYILPPHTVDLFAVLAILNSAVSEWRFRLTSTNNHVNSYEVDGLPFPRFAFTTPAGERKRHGAKARQAYERGLSDGDDTAALTLVDEHLKAARTDVVHDLLAFLAERMMALNQEKHEAARGFLTDLKDFHGVDAHSLKPKTRLDEFWKLEATDVFAHLKANARALAAQGVRLREADEEKIRSRFLKAKDRIVSLEAALSFTDRLIDRIVYRLYDLTPDEIRIVEGEQ